VQSSQPEELLPLPPGRRTHTRFPLLNLFSDDTLKLLNPKSMATYQLDRQREFGGVFKTNVFLMPTVVCTTQEALVELGKKEGPGRLRAFFPPHHQKLYGPSSLLVTSGLKHDRIRRLLSGNLSPSVVESSYRPVVSRQVDRFFNRLQQEAASRQDYFAVVPRVRSFFVRLMLRIVLDAPEQQRGLAEEGDGGDGDGDGNGKDVDVDELASNIELWSRGLLAPPLTFLPWSTAARAMRARDRVATKLRSIMDDMEKAMAKASSTSTTATSAGGNSEGGGLLSKLLSAVDKTEGKLSKDEIIDNVLTLLFAGSDTTASATVSLWRVLSELDDGDPVREWLASEASDEQVDRFLEERVLSRYPPAPFGMRISGGGSDLEVGGYRIPSGWLVVYGFAGALLSRPPAPPADGNDDSASKGPSTTSIPFGTGPRQCPGRFLANLELRAVARKLATLKVTLDPDQDLEQQYTPGFFPRDGFRVKFAS
jgi:cytochrome P450